MIRPATHPVTADNGPRPAGRPDECFYCRAKIGEMHQPDCVCRKKTVVITYQVEVVVDVPESWTEAQMLFHRNEGTSCSDNVLDEIERQTKHFEDSTIKLNDVASSGPCWCDWIKAISMRDATEDEDFFTDAELLR